MNTWLRRFINWSRSLWSEERLLKSSVTILCIGREIRRFNPVATMSKVLLRRDMEVPFFLLSQERIGPAAKTSLRRALPEKRRRRSVVPRESTMGSRSRCSRSVRRKRTFSADSVQPFSLQGSRNKLGLSDTSACVRVLQSAACYCPGATNPGQFLLEMDPRLGRGLKSLLQPR
jgi:hypothetical protein